MRPSLRVGLGVAALGLALGAAALLTRSGARPAAERDAPQPQLQPESQPPSSPAPAQPATPALIPDAAGPAARASEPLDVERSSEQALMAEAERLLGAAPQQTLSLIEAADRRFGSSVEARRKLEIEALVRLQRIGLAHSKAERFYRAFPDSPSIREIERRTGYHPRPMGPPQ